MSASLIEQTLARIQQVLLGATAAGSRVERGRDEGVAPDEMPAITIRRQSGTVERNGLNSCQIQGSVDLDFWAAGPDWETQADAVHMSAHALLLADAVLRGRITDCTSVQSAGASGEYLAGRLTATYAFTLSAAPADLTTPR